MTDETGSTNFIYQIASDQGDGPLHGFKILEEAAEPLRFVDYGVSPREGNVKLEDGKRIGELGGGYSGGQGEPGRPPHQAAMGWGGPHRKMPALEKASSMHIVSPEFKAVLEALEPGKHQYIPLETVWKNGTPAGQFFWFFPQQRIDAMDLEKSTHQRRKHGWVIRGRENKLVANLSQIGSNHLWVDPMINGNAPYVSQAFKDAMEEAGVNGIKYYEIEAF